MFSFLQTINLGIIDIAILSSIIFFSLYGFFLGLIRTAGSIISFFLGAWVAGRYYLVFSSWTGGLFFGLTNLNKVTSFIIVFVLAKNIFNLIFWLINHAYHLISFIPLSGLINRLGGLILGLIEGALLSGLIIYVTSRYASFDSSVGIYLINSKFAPFVLKVNQIVLPFLPEILKKLKAII